MRRNSTSLVLFVAALSFAAVGRNVAEAVIVRHDRSLELTLELGARFPFVCGAGASTGTLIAPRWVLTAAHVVEKFGPFDYRVRCGDREYEVARTFIHPGDDERPWDRRTNDVALLLLEESVDAVTPVALYRGTGELGEMEELGKSAVIVGTGFYGRAGEGANERDGRLRAVTNRISDLDRDWLKTVFSRPPGGTELEGLSAAGDSGGPLLVETEDGILLVGVSSYGEYIDAEGGEETYGAMDFFARVSSYLTWIDGVMAAVEAGRAVASEGPAPPGGIEEARDGLPQNDSWERVAAYFEAFNSGRAELFAEFSRQHRTAKSLAGSTMEERLKGYLETFEQWGRLVPLRYVQTGPDELSVLARSEVGEIVFGFRLEAATPRKLAAISVSY